ncbi:hypothetical protein GS930_19730 [Rhodococcus hoagii]|nr:hypothetical protein [Prescottella equi]
MVPAAGDRRDDGGRRVGVIHRGSERAERRATSTTTRTSARSSPKPPPQFLGAWRAPTRCSPRNSESAALNAGAGPAGDRPVSQYRTPSPDDAERARLCGDRHCRATRRADPAGSARRGVGHGAVQGRWREHRCLRSPVGRRVPQACSYAFGSLGAHSITAVYSGGAGFASSTSEARTVTVTPPVVATSTTVTVPPTATTDLAVDLVAAVTPVGASGTVSVQGRCFRDRCTGSRHRRSRVTLPHASRQLAPTASPAVYSGGACFGRPPRVRVDGDRVGAHARRRCHRHR